MTSTFFGLELGLRALRSQQTALDVTNHNVANANTPGFSRQSAVLETTLPYTLPTESSALWAGELGTGVQVAAIQRARDIFLDVQYRLQLGALHQAQVTHDSLEQVEVVLNEPSDSGLSAMLDDFFDAWQRLVNDPADRSVRASLVQQATALAAGFNRAADLLGSVQQDLNQQVQIKADTATNLAAQIATLNQQIVQVEAAGQRANDFRDRRDLLLDQLAELMQISVTENPDGSVNVSVGGHALVTGITADGFALTPTGPNGMWEVRFASDNALVNLGSGEIQGLIDARDTKVPGYLAQLDQIASDLITNVNALHVTGYGRDNVTGRPFFSGTGAGDIAVDAAIAADPDKVAAASAPGQAGNSAVALAIAQLRTTLNPGQAYAALIAALGVDSKAASDLAENQDTLVKLLDQRRQAISGVSLDEEAVQMVRFQRAYEAAARLLTAQDELLDRLINQTGLVGR